MGKPLVVGNWKTYTSLRSEALKLFKKIEKSIPRGTDAEVVVCPPAPLLGVLAGSYSGKRVVFGAQDVSADGALTGGTEAHLIADLGARYAIVGHAERRAEGDTDEVVARKLVAALGAGLTPILCVGESARDLDGAYLATLEKSLTASLARLDGALFKKVVVAYEPVWAIGAAEAPAASIVREALIFIRKVLASRFDRAVAMRTRVLYGGAVTEANARVLIEEGGASGFLVGRASTDAEEFIGIIRATG